MHSTIRYSYAYQVQYSYILPVPYEGWFIEKPVLFSDDFGRLLEQPYKPGIYAFFLAHTHCETVLLFTPTKCIHDVRENGS